ncbi:hypothetical protein [Krasilnikovia sp. M28-CT-15]|uniref:hypothetical protein n=1 Tax=Krasilnikovia sp. M28-CT-15 TaxID=3373540 RepID=UPI00387742A4
MIPSLAVVRVRGGRRRAIQLWLPIFLLWPLLLPFALALAIGGPVLARVTGVGAADTWRIGWQLLSGCRGAHLAVDTPGFAFQARFI